MFPEALKLSCIFHTFNGDSFGVKVKCGKFHTFYFEGFPEQYQVSLKFLNWLTSHKGGQITK